MPPKFKKVKRSEENNATSQTLEPLSLTSVGLRRSTVGTFGTSKKNRVTCSTLQKKLKNLGSSEKKTGVCFKHLICAYVASKIEYDVYTIRCILYAICRLVFAIFGVDLCKFIFTNNQKHIFICLLVNFLDLCIFLPSFSSMFSSLLEDSLPDLVGQPSWQLRVDIMLEDGNKELACTPMQV